MKKCFILLCLIGMMMCLLPLRAQAAGVGDAQITVPFGSLGGKVFSWDFPYSDTLFDGKPVEFSEDLVKASLGLAISAFQDRSGRNPLQYETYLGGAGFKDIYAFGYDQPTSQSSLAGVIGWKKIGPYIVIAAAPRGSGYEKEWGGNLDVGTGERHAGFDRGAVIFGREITEYIRRNGLIGKIKLWLSGFSRAAAVSNLTAAAMIDSGRFEGVYAYLFGVPRTTKAQDSAFYDGIFNICGKNDPVTQVASEKWGYRRYGEDLFLPSPETNGEFMKLAAQANKVCRKVTGDIFRYDPEVNYQVHMILEFLTEMFPTSDDYAEQFQDILMTLWTEANPDRILNILSEAVRQLQLLDRRRENSSRVLIEYLSMVSSQHLTEDKRQIEAGFWNPDQGLGENLMREHLPYTYLTWVFSGVRRSELYYSNDFTRRICLFGDAEVEVWRNGVLAALALTEDAFIYSRLDYGSYDPESSTAYNVFIARNGDETVINLPFDDPYTVKVRTKGLQTPVNIYDVICAPYYTFGLTDTMFMYSLGEGEYRLEIEPMPDMPELIADSGNVYSVRELEFGYSPTVVMANEVGDKHYVRLSSLLGIFASSTVLIFLILAVSLALYLLHRKKKKEGRAYSPWFVIVSHLILILLFALMTRYFTVSLFSVGSVRQVYAGLTMLTLLLLSLRGTLYSRSRVSLLITLGLLALGAVNIFLYQRGTRVTGHVVQSVVYLAVIAAAAVPAAATFFLGKKGGEEQAAG